MKKTTINAILISIITIMSVSICFLIFCIVTRPRYVIDNEPEPAMITEASILSEDAQQPEKPADDGIPEPPSVEQPPADTKHGKTSTRVNIRDAATENAKVLDTVDEGTTFDILQVLDNGWTKILYEGSEAYISSSYVIIIND